MLASCVLPIASLKMNNILHVVVPILCDLRLLVSSEKMPSLQKRCTTPWILCVGCKGCKRECPTGIDMAKMKTEFLHHYHQKHGLTLRDRVFAYLPRYAPKLKYLSFLLNLRDQIPGFAKISEWILGVSSKRKLPKWRSDQFKPNKEESSNVENRPEVVLLVDTF